MIKNATRAAVPTRSDARARPRRVARRASWKRRIKTAFALMLLLAETVVALLLVCGLAVFWNFSSELSNFSSIISENREPVSTKIWSEDGVLLGKLEAENRQPITLKELGRCQVVDATIAIEDHRFYEHPGIDVFGIARATLANLRGNNRAAVRAQGASTLTQQLVRQPGIGTQFGLNNERHFSRKIREALVALRVEQLYTKPEILRLYLNNVYYGAGAYGVQAAAKTYFNKPASQLTLSQAALVAGLPQSPSELSPFRHRQSALRRRDEVLDAMLEYGKITKPALDEAKSEAIVLAPPPKHNHFDFKAPYFTTYVLHELTKNYASDMVYSGLSVRTTLNWKIQQAAERALQNGLANASGLGANQGAIVAIDPQSGYIRAMVGGRDFHASQYNAVTQGRRQPGSTFKVFDYTAAFDTGASKLDDVFIDKPIPYPNDPEHLVKNYGDGYSYSGISCRTAIEFSKNTIAVQVAQKVGIKTVIDYAYKMGISTPLAPYLPTALGASAVKPIDLCSAYSIFASGGVRCHPMAIARVSDAEGNALDSSRYTPQKEVDILKASTISQMNEALQGVVEHGTGTLARGDESTGIVDGAHGKTGTTSDNRDAWFAGYTPELTTVVWVASVHKRGKKLVYAEMAGATGGHQCAPIWHDFMIQAVPVQRKFNELVQHMDMPKPKTVATNSEPPKPRRRKPAAPRTETPASGASQAPVPAQGPAAPQPDTTTDVTPDAPDLAPDSEATPGPASASSTTTRTGATLAPPYASAPGAALPADPAAERRAGAFGAPRAAPPPTGRIHTSQPAIRVAPRTAPPEPLVSVTVCGDTGDIANPYCDTYKTVHVTAAQAARMHRCRLHRAPPGEGH